MFQRRIPEPLRHAPAPGVRGFAILAGAESSARAILTSVFPIVMYRAFGDAETVSEVYFLIGIASLLAALIAPWVSRFIPRRKLYTCAGVGMIVGAVCSSFGGAWLVAMGLTTVTISTVVITVCFNAYVMDYIERSSLGESETLRLFYSGAAWTIGPYLGIWLMNVWTPAPFILSAVAASVLLVIFWVMRLGDGKVIAKARGPAPNPLAYLPRFFAQPRLIAGWSFAVLRSCGWWVYVVYLPIYAVENGYGEETGGLALSISNGFLFLTPLMLRWMKRHSIRRAIVLGFAGSGCAFFLAMPLSHIPSVTLAILLFATLFLILLDMCAGLPFLMGVKPSERTEMSAVYSTYRDVSGVVSPGVARIVLALAPLPAIFAVVGLGLGAMMIVGARLHPRLGIKRVLAEAPPAA